MANVGDDVGVLTDLVGDSKDLVLNIQNLYFLIKLLLKLIMNFDQVNLIPRNGKRNKK